MNYGFAGVLPVLAGLALALSVFACGGNDSPTQTQRMQEPTPTTQTQTENDIINNAATNRPRAGSVSQGSRRGQTEQGQLTPDTVTWNGSGGDAVRVTVAGVETGPDPDENSSEILEEVFSPNGVLDLVAVPGSSGSAIVQVVSGVTYTATSGEFTPSLSVDRADPDLVFGVWATEDSNGDITAIGAFADGEETPSAELPTSGTYTGNLFAFYQKFDSDGAITTADYSVASVTLTVAADGSVSGTVSRIADRNDRDEDTFAFIDESGEDATVVNLASSAPRGAAPANGGFFNSTTSVEIGGQAPSNGTSTGRWGGQFFGADGENIAGTIGLNVEYQDDTGFTVFGSFSASRPEN